MFIPQENLQMYAKTALQMIQRAHVQEKNLFKKPSFLTFIAESLFSSNLL